MYVCMCTSIVNEILLLFHVSLYMTLGIDIVDGDDLRKKVHHERRPGNAGNQMNTSDFHTISLIN